MKTAKKILILISFLLISRTETNANIPAADSNCNGLFDSKGGLIWIDDRTGCFGDTVVVNINIANPDNPLDSFGFYLSYDPAILSYTSCTAGDLDPGWEVFGCNEPVPGIIHCGGFSYPEVIPTGSNGCIMEISFDVSCTACQNGDRCDLSFSNLSDDLVTYSHMDGQFAYYCTPPATQTPTTTDTITVGNIMGCQEDLIDLNINISNPVTPVDSFGFYLEYCTDQLEFMSCTSGTLNPGWTLFGCNEPEVGQVRVAGFSHPGVIPAGSSGILTVMTFKVKCSFCSQGQTCNPFISLLSDDLAGWNNVPGVFTCSCTPTPIPTPITGDRIWLQNFQGCTGDTVTVDIMIDNPETSVDSFGLYLDYCHDSVLEFLNCEPGTLNPGWVVFGCNEPVPGEIRSGGFIVSGEISQGSSGSLVRLNFIVTCTDCVNGQTWTLPISRLTDDVNGWLIQNGNFTYSCPTQTPTVTQTTTITPSPTVTSTPTNTGTTTPAPSRTPTPTAIPSSTPTLSYTQTPSISNTPTSTSSPPQVPCSAPINNLILLFILTSLIFAHAQNK